MLEIYEVLKCFIPRGWLASCHQHVCVHCVRAGGSRETMRGVRSAAWREARYCPRRPPGVCRPRNEGHPEKGRRAGDEDPSLPQGSASGVGIRAHTRRSSRQPTSRKGALSSSLPCESPSPSSYKVSGRVSCRCVCGVGRLYPPAVTCCHPHFSAAPYFFLGAQFFCCS